MVSPQGLLIVALPVTGVVAISVTGGNESRRAVDCGAPVTGGSESKRAVDCGGPCHGRR